MFHGLYVCTALLAVRLLHGQACGPLALCDSPTRLCAVLSALHFCQPSHHGGCIPDKVPKHTSAPSERRGVGVDDGAILPNLIVWFLVCSVTDLEAELAQLILTEQLDARIDSDKKVCTASTPNSAAAHHHGRAC